MKRCPSLLSLIVVLVALTIGLGFYMGWFQLSSSSENNKPNISLTVDGNKLAADKNKVVDAVQDLGHKANDKANDKVADTTPKTDETPAGPAQPPTGQD
jgi:hypothetical protein